MLSKIIPENWLPYIIHTRPKSWLIMFIHMSVGYFLACEMKITKENLLLFIAAAIIWGVLGNGGGVALNSAFDKDTGNITYLDNPPPVPRYLAQFGILVQVTGLILAWFISTRFFLVSLFCFVMGVLYSVPPFRFKTRPGLDVLTNVLVYGSLTPYAGWASMDRPLGPPMVSLLFVYFLLGWGFIPINQIFQMEEDALRGDRTWALALGKKRTLWLVMLAILAGNCLLFIEVSKRYWGPRSLGFLVVLGMWIAVLVPWYRQYNKVDSHYEQKGMYLSIVALAITDLVIVLAMAFK